MGAFFFRRRRPLERPASGVDEGANLTSAFTPDADDLDDTLTVRHTDDFNVGDVILLWYRAGEPVEATVKSKDGTTLVVSDVDTAFPQYAGIRVKGNDELVADVARNALKVSYGDDPSGRDGGVFYDFIELQGWNVIPNYVLSNKNDPQFELFLNRWRKDQEKTQDYFSITMCSTGSLGGIAYPPSQVSAVFANEGLSSPNQREVTLSHEVGHLQMLMPEGSRNGHVDNFVDAPNWDNSTHCLMSYNRDRQMPGKLDMDCIYRMRDGVVLY